MSKLYRENIGESEIIDTLTPMLHHYASDRAQGEHFGDFVVRSGYVKAVSDGTDFHS